MATKLVLALILLLITIGVSSARPEPSSVSIEAALKAAATTSPLAAGEAKVFHVLVKKRIPPSGPSNRGHSVPISTRHLLNLLPPAYI
ncbi:hypothetical protein Cni_G10789 [Canna indica]|uniref:Uncharacterized protein n=1 Tax=Canna indica TaxID=4628 RepID=A0AAQ3QB06_9LILI|nr:hypothetical protein Cni_G10789 [Canna indica]